MAAISKMPQMTSQRIGLRRRDEKPSVKTPLSTVSVPPTDFVLVVSMFYVFSLPAGTGYCRSVERELVRSVIKVLISEPDPFRCGCSRSCGGSSELIGRASGPQGIGWPADLRRRRSDDDIAMPLIIRRGCLDQFAAAKSVGTHVARAAKSKGLKA